MPVDRKLSIFVGSTFRDFQGPREDIIRVLLEAGHIPSGMELWSAGHVPTQEQIQVELELCDLHFILSGAKYGSTVEGGISFTEWEYQISKARNRPIIALLLEEDEFNKGIKKLNVGERKKLKRFRSKLESNALCRYFSYQKPNSLGVDCLNSVSNAINSGKLHKNWGWVRANTELGEKISAVQSDFLQRILDRVYRFTTLTNRLETEASYKKLSGEIFWRLMLGRIRRARFRDVFFESGSTLAYVANEFEEILNASQSDHAEWRVTTNNVLTLLDFLLYTDLDVRPSPAGTPEDKYGAIFGEILLRNPESQPNIPRPFFTTEKSAISATAKILQQDETRRLFLMTASGIDLDHQHSEFRGPHVGSHANALFKRAIFETKQPVTMFLHDLKLQPPFNFQMGRCYPVFDAECTWQSVCQSLPLSICVAYRIGEPNVGTPTCAMLKSLLKESGEFDGFDFEYAQEERTNGGAFIIANNQFKKLFPKE